MWHFRLTEARSRMRHIDSKNELACRHQATGQPEGSRARPPRDGRRRVLSYSSVICINEWRGLSSKWSKARGSAP